MGRSPIRFPGSNAGMFKKIDIEKADVARSIEEKEFLAAQAKAQAEEAAFKLDAEKNCIYVRLVDQSVSALYADSITYGLRGFFGFSPVVNRGRMAFAWPHVSVITILEEHASEKVREVYRELVSQWLDIQHFPDYTPPPLPVVPEPPAEIKA